MPKMTIDEQELNLIGAFASWCDIRSNDPAFTLFERGIWSLMGDTLRNGQALLLEPIAAIPDEATKNAVTDKRFWN